MAHPRKDEADKYVKMNVSFEPRQLDQLLAVCQKEDRTISYIIRKALEAYLPSE